MASKYHVTPPHYGQSEYIQATVPIIPLDKVADAQATMKGDRVVHIVARRSSDDDMKDGVRKFTWPPTLLRKPFDVTEVDFFAPQTAASFHEMCKDWLVKCPSLKRVGVVLPPSTGTESATTTVWPPVRCTEALCLDLRDAMQGLRNGAETAFLHANMAAKELHLILEDAGESAAQYMNDVIFPALANRRSPNTMQLHLWLHCDQRNHPILNEGPGQEKKQQLSTIATQLITRPDVPVGRLHLVYHVDADTTEAAQNVFNAAIDHGVQVTAYEMLPRIGANEWRGKDNVFDKSRDVIVLRPCPPDRKITESI